MDIKVLASGSSGNCYRVSDGHTTLLLDAGIPFRQIQVGCDFKVSQIKGCFVTHSHQDHCKAVKDLVKAGVDVYTSQGTVSSCGYTGHRIHVVKGLHEITVGTFSIIPFDVQHDVPEPLGFLLISKATGEKLLYFTDTYYVKYQFKGLTHIMAECNYDEETLKQSVENKYINEHLATRVLRSHMSLEHLIDMLKVNDLSKVKQIYLLHLSDNNSHEDRFKQEIQKLTGTEVYIC